MALFLRQMQTEHEHYIDFNSSWVVESDFYTFKFQEYFSPQVLEAAYYQSESGTSDA